MAGEPDDLHRRLADELVRAQTERRPVAPLTERWPDLSVADAYAIQRLNARRRLDAGVRLVGHKIGLTSKAMQEMLGVDQPDYGHLFDEMTLSSGDIVARDELIAPRVEPEIAFVLGDRVEGPGVTAAQVMGATKAVLPALEVIDSRIADWRIALVDTVADNASCGRMVLGSDRAAADEHDLAEVAVRLMADGEIVQKGKGSAVLGHPAEAVAWLANALADYEVALTPGDVVLPGSCTAAVEMKAGSTYSADFGALGGVEVSCR